MNDRDEIIDFIHHNSFAILISENEGILNATHVPVLFKSDVGGNGFLYGHISRANLQWKNIDEEVLVVFPGAHKYISPTWYETNQSVPTWSYMSVHARGKIKIFEDRESKIEIVKESVKYFEGKESKYNIEDIDEKYFEGLIKGITAFKIEITQLDGKIKISQNHSEERQKRVINKLEEIEDGDSKIIAEQMKKNLK